MKIKLPFHKQRTEYNCGPASLEMVLDYFKHHMSQEKLSRLAKTDKEKGTGHQEMINVATRLGFYCYANDDSNLDEIKSFLERKLPIIVNFIEPSDDEGHYAVVSGLSGREVILNDPWNGKNFKMNKKSFLSRWHDGSHKQSLLVLSKKDLQLGKQFLPK